MTTGAPLVVRASMKPLPTLTKPLRSVDIATHEPAEALRERTDSCTVPAAGVVGEAMVAFVLADAYRRKFGGDHIDDVRASLGGIRGTDRVAAPVAEANSAAQRKVVCIGFMGAGKSTAAQSAAQALGAAPVDVDSVIEERLGKPIDRVFAEDGEAEFRAVEEEVTLELLACGTPAVLALGGGAIGHERVRAALSEHLVDMARRRPRARVGAVPGQRPAARPRARPVRAPLSRCASRSTPGSPT